MKSRDTFITILLPQTIGFSPSSPSVFESLRHQERHKVYIRWYNLRCTTASVLLRAGTNPTIVAEKLGHSAVNLTLNVYSHTIPSMQHEAATDFEKPCADRRESGTK
jgi:integrase